MAKSNGTGAGWGGRRAGAGRKPGSKSKTPPRVRRLLTEMARREGLELPVDRLLRRMNDASLPEDYRDQLAMAVAPYTAPRLSSVAITKRPAQMTDEELAALAGITEEDLLRAGEGREKWPRPLH